MIVARRREKVIFFFEKSYFFTATMQTCKVLSAFTLAPVASYQINRKSSLPFSGAIIPALKHRIPSELRSRSEEHTCELQSHSDLVCRLLLEKQIAVRFEPHFSIHSF